MVASHSPEAIRDIVTESSNIVASSNDIRQSRDTPEMTSVSTRDADGGVSGDDGTRM